MNKGSLRLRLFVAGAVSILVAVSLSGLGLVYLFERHVERRVAAELEVYVEQIVAGIDRNADGALTISRPLIDPRFSRPLSGLYWQVQADDGTLRSRSLWDARLELPADELADGGAHEHRIADPAGGELIAVERMVKLPQRLGGTTVRATAAVNRSEIDTATRSFATDLLPYLITLATFLIAAAYAQVTVGLRPLGRVRERLSGIRQGRDRRLGTEFPDEIVPLAEEVDQLLTARETQLARARARAADLAHGLKTPLQVLAGDVARLRDRGEPEMAAEIEQVATTMQRHVDRELARARMAAGAPDATAQVAEVVDRVVAVVARSPNGSELNWHVDIPRSCAARIDPDDLAEAVGNLTENAARHARTSVAIAAATAEAELVISVTDDGPGIPADQIERALTRGGRVDVAGPNTGLGLSIVSDIAEIWGGRLEMGGGDGAFAVSLHLGAADKRDQRPATRSAAR